jgi:hypothetical protein
MNEIHVVEQGDIVFCRSQNIMIRHLTRQQLHILINKSRLSLKEALLISDDPFRALIR